MINLKTIKKNLIQIFALTEKDLKLTLRYKSTMLTLLITPFFPLLMALIIMNKFFKTNAKFGPWTAENYLVFLFIAYNIILLRRIISTLPNQLRTEKFWQTLVALMVAPFNRFNLLCGFFFSHLIVISIPFILFFIYCYIFYPIALLTVFFIIVMFLLLALIFSGVGLIFGICAINQENVWRYLQTLLSIFFFLSCITYPYELFPPLIQNLISLNPLYYLFDLIRLIWIEDNIIISITSHTLHIFVFIMCGILFPLIGIFIFNIIYKKYGIVGY